MEKRLDWKKWRVVTGIFLVTNLAFVIQRVVFDVQRGLPGEILNSVLDLAGFAGIWVLFTVPILILTVDRRLDVAGVAVLVLVGVVLSFLHAALYLLFAMSIPGLMTLGQIGSPAEYFETLAGLGHAWRFLSYGFIVVVCYAYDYYVLSKEREHRAAQLQVQLSESKLNALRMQLHPHFLFNTLNAITALIDEQPEAAKQTLARLSDLLRLALDNVSTHEVPLRRELEFVDLYLRIQKTRYGDRLTVSTEIPPGLLGAAVPYLILQPIIENALKHGIDALPGPGTLGISAVTSDGLLVLRIEDSGTGRRGRGPDGGARGTDGLGLGLANTRARLSALYGDRSSLSLGEIPEDRGMRVTLTIPLRYIPDEPTGRERRGNG